MDEEWISPQAGGEPPAAEWKELHEDENDERRRFSEEERVEVAFHIPRD